MTVLHSEQGRGETSAAAAHDGAAHTHARGSGTRWLWLGLAVLTLAVGLRLVFVGSARVRSGSMIPTLRVADRVLIDKTAYGIRIPGTRRWLTDTATPALGEVVVFDYPYQDESESVGRDMIKRVVGVPGDRVRIRNGRLSYDGLPGVRRPHEPVLPCDAPPDHTCDDALECSGQIAYVVRRHLPIAGVANRARLPENWPPRIFNPLRYSRNARRYSPPMNRMWPDFEVPPGTVLVLGDNRDVSRDGRHFGLVPIQFLVGRAHWIWFAQDDGGWLPDFARLTTSLHAASPKVCAPQPSPGLN